MKKVLGIVLLFVLVIGLASCGSTGEFDVDSESEIVVGLEAAYAPFNWATPDQNDFTVELDGQSGMYVDGFDVVMASQIAEELGLTLVVKAIEWDGLIPALLSGEIDLIIAGMSPTAERAQTVSFTDEYYRSEQVIVVNTSGNYADATSLTDFSGARIVAQLGTLQDDLIDQIANVNHLEALNDYPTLTTALTNQAADGFVAELPVAQGVVQSNPTQFTYISFTEGNGFSVSDEDVAVAVALRQEDVALLALINAILADISTETRNGYMEAALSRQPQA
ncbi:MAG: transporter substrate-binding domain-containing protein [Acholeplasmataceae bacterium]|nr:transporter substrate-binding domain-containing protein [Acholeplasmataceae bacterium]